MTMHGKLKEPKKFLTPAPNKYEVGIYGERTKPDITLLFLQAIIPEEQPSFAFGVKHSPYIYQHNSEQFRPRGGTFTKDKPSNPPKLRSAAAIKQEQMAA